MIPKLLGILVLEAFAPPLWAAEPPVAKTARPVADPAADSAFNPSFFGKSATGQNLDLSRFEKANQASPGTYRADVYVNDNWIGRRDVQLKQSGALVLPCMDRKLMEEAGLNLAHLPPEANAEQQLANNACIDIASIVPASKQTFDPSDLRLDVSIPQRYVRSTMRGYVDPKYWDAGMPFAGFLAYNANTYRNDNKGQRSTQSFVSANAGVNIIGWRLRYTGQLSQADTQGSSTRTYRGQAFYGQHDLTDWRAQLTVGDSQTPGDFFNSVLFRGVQIGSDDRMYPSTLQGYAPQVRGVAETNARVSVKQNGNTIYETTVPPGEFSIDDLFNTGFNGDLQVTITEADGRIKQYTIPYSSVSQLLRPGISRFSLLAGQLRNDRLTKLPSFVQGTYQRGLSNEMTLYGGGIASSHYVQALLGMAFNTVWGAFSVDMRRSQASGFVEPKSGRTSLNGQSFSIAYSKLVSETRTNFTVAAYRYSTDGFLELSDFANLENNQSVYRQRSRFQLNVNQPLPGNWGQLFLSGSAQNYWNAPNSSVTYQAGYIKTLRWGSMSLSASRTLNSLGGATTQYTLGLNIPLGSGANTSQLSASFTQDSNHNQSDQVTLTGTAGEQSNLSYTAFGSYQKTAGQNTSSGGGGSLQYNTSVANLSASASSQGSSTQTSVGAAGALVFHPGGVTASQAIGDSFAIIEADGAQGAVVEGGNGIKVGADGFAVVPSLMPYRANEISLDPKNVNADVELETTAVEVVPRAGAIQLIKFPTAKGVAALVHLTRPDNAALPVGASIENADQTVGMVGQGGWTYLRAMAGKTLTASWGPGTANQCQFSYQMPQVDKQARKAPMLPRIEAACTGMAPAAVAAAVPR